MCQYCNSNILDSNAVELQSAEAACRCSTGMSGRYLQPCLLLVLGQKDSYGYELIEEVAKLGASPDASAVYRTLRKMENEGFVKSAWNMEEPGPARRFYKITSDGEDLLRAWTVVLNNNKKSLEHFVEEYNKTFEKNTIGHK